MRKLITIITTLLIGLNTQAQTRLWTLNLIDDNHKENLTLTKNGNKITGNLNDGGNLNITIKGNKVTGYFRYNRKIYKLEAQRYYDVISGENFAGKYCSCSGKPDKSFYLAKKNTIATTNMQGTWSSSFGELRLKQNGSRVYGDYKNVGTIKATMKGNLVSGEFTNGSKKGKLQWILTDGKFTGKWAWGNNTLGGSWTGTLKSTKAPVLKNSKTTTASNFNGIIKTNKEAEAFIRAQKKLGKSAKKTIESLKTKGFQNTDIIVAFVKKHYQLSSQEMLNAFKYSNYKVSSVLTAIKNRYNTNANTLLKIAKTANYNVNDIARSLENDYSLRQDAIIKLLKSNNYSISQIGNVLRKVFSIDGYTAAKVMQKANLQADFIFKVLKNNYNSSYKTVAKIGNDILHFNAYKTAYNLYKVYNLKANQLASAIYNDAKYGLNECISAVMKIYNMGKSAVTSLF